MRKKIIVVFFGLIFLSGCTSIPSSTPTGDVLADDVTKIIIWGMFETEENIQPLVSEFESNNPGVEVEYTLWNKDEYATKLAEVLQDGNANTTPDVFLIHNSWVGNYSSYLSNAPSGIFPVDEFTSEFHDFVSEDFGHGGVVRGVPLWVDLLGIVYHEAYLFESGDTSIASNWNDFRTQAINMTKSDEENTIKRAGFSGGRSNNVEFAFELLNLLFLQSRPQPFTEESLAVPYIEGEEYDLNEAVQFYKSFAGSTQNTWNNGFKLDTATFIEGNLSSIILPTWRILDILAFDTDRNLNLKLGTAPVPQLNPETLPPVSAPTYWGFVVSKDSTKINTAWEFLRFITTKDSQQTYMDTQLANGRPFPMISPRRDLLSVSSEYDLLSPYVDSIEIAHSWYMINGSKLEDTYKDLIDGSGDIEDISVKFKDLEEDKNLI